MRKLGFFSLGCAKNLVDSENMLAALARRGWAICEDIRDADLVLINSCGFIEEARDEAREVIKEAMSLKAGGTVRRIVVAGCLAQRFSAQFSGEFPEVDGWIGLRAPEEVAEFCDRVLDGERAVVSGGGGALAAETGRLRLTARHIAYLRIADGCDNRCHYCTVPLIRGRYRSKPMEDVIAEARELVADGAIELNIIAQDTTNYGVDLYGKRCLPELLRRLLDIEGFDWLRLLYTHPAHWTDELVEILASDKRICRYVDLPVQHINDRVLEAMGRKVARQDIENLIQKLRSRIPHLALRTAIIVGFPGETEAEFSELLTFVKRTRFERLGAFKYSREAGTPAAELPNQVPEDVKEERFNRLLETQRKIARQWNRTHLGKRLAVMVDRPGAEANGVWECRTEWDAPEVDGRVLVRSSGELESGKIVRAYVVGVRDYDLLGETRPRRKGTGTFERSVTP